MIMSELWKELHQRPFEFVPTSQQPNDRPWIDAWGKKIPRFTQGCSCNEFWKNWFHSNQPLFFQTFKGTGNPGKIQQEVQRIQNEYFEWTVRAHNAVNRKLGKPEWKVEDCRIQVLGQLFDKSLSPVKSLPELEPLVHIHAETQQKQLQPPPPEPNENYTPDVVSVSQQHRVSIDTIIDPAHLVHPVQPLTTTEIELSPPLLPLVANSQSASNTLSNVELPVDAERQMKIPHSAVDSESVSIRLPPNDVLPKVSTEPLPLIQSTPVLLPIHPSTTTIPEVSPPKQSTVVDALPQKPKPPPAQIGPSVKRIVIPKKQTLTNTTTLKPPSSNQAAQKQVKKETKQWIRPTTSTTRH